MSMSITSSNWERSFMSRLRFRGKGEQLNSFLMDLQQLKYCYGRCRGRAQYVNGRARPPALSENDYMRGLIDGWDAAAALDRARRAS